MYNTYSNPYMYGVNPVQNYGIPNQQYYPNVQNTNDMPMQGVKFVTQDEAKAYMVMPNQRVLLMDKNNSLFYIKSADSLGQSNLEAYEFKKIDINNPKQPEQNTGPKFDIENLVKKDQLDNLVTKDKLGEELKAVRIDLTQKIDELKKSINIKKYLEGDIKDV